MSIPSYIQTFSTDIDVANTDTLLHLLAPGEIFIAFTKEVVANGDAVVPPGTKVVFKESNGGLISVVACGSRENIKEFYSSGNAIKVRSASVGMTCSMTGIVFEGTWPSPGPTPEESSTSGEEGSSASGGEGGSSSSAGGGDYSTIYLTMSGEWADSRYNGMYTYYDDNVSTFPNGYWKKEDYILGKTNNDGWLLRKEDEAGYYQLQGNQYAGIGDLIGMTQFDLFGGEGDYYGTSNVTISTNPQ